MFSMVISGSKVSEGEKFLHSCLSAFSAKTSTYQISAERKHYAEMLGVHNSVTHQDKPKLRRIKTTCCGKLVSGGRIAADP